MCPAILVGYTFKKYRNNHKYYNGKEIYHL